MTTRAQLEPLLQGTDPLCSAIIAWLLARGWKDDRIIKNVATKTYAPNQASLRVLLDADNDRYYVTGEYTSAGENVLATCYAYIDATAVAAQCDNILTRFMENVERQIAGSFAVRFLGAK